MPSNAQLQANIEDLKALIKSSVDEIKAANDETKAELTDKINELSGKFDVINGKLDKQAERIEKAENKVDELEAKLNQTIEKLNVDFKTLSDRVKKVEDEIGPLENIPKMVLELRETVEERTNRQLRETLIFKNIPEEPNEDWEATKALLATTISENCATISFDDAFDGIKRCHRESAKKQERAENDERPSRAGKRNIFAAMFSWEMCQTIIESFRKNDSPIYAEQMYGPRTTKRRGLALQLRKQLKQEGVIAGGFVNFPAKLFVNYVGHVDAEGKKIYKFHSDLSRAEVN